MKNVFSGLLLGAAACAFALPAYANNKNVEEAIHDRGDLGTFYQALMANGIFSELDENKDYTVFAPVDESFEKLPRAQYACFYDGTCRAEAAPILRNHFLVGAYTDEDLTHQAGGLESINPGRDVHIGEPSKHDYAVDGNMIVYMSTIYSGKLYKIEGVIADHEELNALAHPQVHAANAPAPAAPAAGAEDGDDVPDTTCEMDDCSDHAQAAANAAAPAAAPAAAVTPPAATTPAATPDAPPPVVTNIINVPVTTTTTPVTAPEAEAPIKTLYPGQ